MAHLTHPFVSVLTPTYNRRRFIPYAIQFFKAQSYPQDKMEWIVMDDGTDKVADLFDPKKTGLKNVRYIALPTGTKLKIGAKRNAMNELAKGDICVCMDDDDYYPPNRVSDAVYRLRSGIKHKIPLVAATEIYLYFTDRGEIWKAGPYNQNHGTNGTMAYWSYYFKDHKYDPEAEKAEERSFTNDWKTPMLQLDGLKTMLVMCHNFNTFDKRRLIENPGPVFKKTSMKLNFFIKDKAARTFYEGLRAEATPYTGPTAAKAAAAGAGAGTKAKASDEEVIAPFETTPEEPKVDTITHTT